MDLNLYLAFQAVAETRSFTRAALRLGLDKSRVSRLIRGLEGELDSALFTRTTRAVELTPEGEQLLKEVQGPLRALAGTERTWASATTAPRGRVSIAATPDLGRTVLAPLLVSFRARHPAVSVRVVLSYEISNFDEQGLDLALRVGKPVQGSYVAKKLGDLRAGFFASPSYLAQRGIPRSADELSEHAGLWPEPGPGKKSFNPRRAGVGFTEAMIACSDFEMLLALARAGGGIALLPVYLADEDVVAGRLKRVLPEVSLGGAPLFLVTRAARPLPARVAALKEHLREGLARRFVP